MKLVLLPFYIIMLLTFGGCTANMQNSAPPSTPSPAITEPSQGIENPGVSTATPIPETPSEPIYEPGNGVSNDNQWIDVVFVDVGQGDGAFIITPNKGVIVIDAGVDKDAHQMIESLSAYEFEDIDLMIISHPHADHIGGASTLLKTYDVKEVLMSSYKATSKVYSNMIEDAAYTKITYAENGMEYDIDNVNVDILAVDTDPRDNNNSSIVARVEYYNVGFMFTGDAEEKTEQTILDNLGNNHIYSNILKVGHHGSRTSSSQAFLEAVSPEYAIISCSVDNKYGHPHMETLMKLNALNIPYFTTADKGNITVRTNGDDIEMYGAKE